jgi:Flp pilus assembly protein TadG
MRRGGGLIRAAARYLAGEGGTAAVEFAIWLIVLVPAVVSAVDVGYYANDVAQVAHAAQAAANAARVTALNGGCTFNSPNTLSTCTGLTTATSAAISSSGAIGSSISKVSSSEQLLYYCASSGGSAAFSTTHTNGCTEDGYYYDVKVSYSFHPIFGAALVVGILNGTANCPNGTAAGTICQEARIRLQ